MAYESTNSNDDSKKYSNKDDGKFFAWGAYILIALGVIISIILVILFG